MGRRERRKWRGECGKEGEREENGERKEREGREMTDLLSEAFVILANMLTSETVQMFFRFRSEYFRN